VGARVGVGASARQQQSQVLAAVWRVAMISSPRYLLTFVMAPAQTGRSLLFPPLLPLLVAVVRMGGERWEKEKKEARAHSLLEEEERTGTSAKVGTEVAVKEERRQQRK